MKLVLHLIFIEGAPWRYRSVELTGVHLTECSGFSQSAADLLKHGEYI